MSHASFSLLLPGKVLHFNTWNGKRRFMDRGNKAGAKLAWKELDDSGLATFMEKPAGRGTRYVSTCKHAWQSQVLFLSLIITQLYYFHKNSVPQNGEEVYTYTFMGYGVCLSSTPKPTSNRT